MKSDVGAELRYCTDAEHDLDRGKIVVGLELQDVEAPIWLVLENEARTPAPSAVLVASRGTRGATHRDPEDLSKAGTVTVVTGIGSSSTRMMLGATFDSPASLSHCTKISRSANWATLSVVARHVIGVQDCGDVLISERVAEKDDRMLNKERHELRSEVRVALVESLVVSCRQDERVGIFVTSMDLAASRPRPGRH